MAWWEERFNKEPDYNYIVGVLLDIYARQKGVEVTHYEVVVRTEGNAPRVTETRTGRQSDERSKHA